MSFYSYSILYNNFLSLSLSLSTCLYYLSYLSFYLYGGYPSCFLPICMWAIYLIYYMDYLSSLSYIYCLSSYPYGGYLSYLLSTYTVFLPIRTGAIPPAYFVCGLSTLFVLLLSNLYSNTYSK